MMNVDMQFKRRITLELKRCSPKQGQVQKFTEIKSKMVNNMCRNKKKKWLNDKITRIEENHKKNETRKFFEGIKNTRQQEINTPKLVKGSDGNIISQTEQVLNRWREYFCDTLNLSDSPAEQVLIEEIINDNQTVDTPSYNEICYIINNLKTNKAAGSDNIPPELIKNGGRTLRKALHRLTLNIWDNEQLPDQWNEGIICPIFKKGDRLNVRIIDKLRYSISHTRYMQFC
jgi:hypothetical protein